MLFCFGNTFGQCVIVSTATSPLCYGDANGQLLVEVSPLCGCQLPLYFRIKNSSTNQVIETTGQINSLNNCFEEAKFKNNRDDCIKKNEKNNFIK